MTENYNPDDFPNDYSHPNAIASKFEEIEHRLEGIESRLDGIENGGSNDHDRSDGVGLWILGSALAITLSWSRNSSILYCIAHGIVSWIYVIYFAFTR